MTDRSHLDETCGQIASRAASAVVARGRLASPALNAALLRRLSAGPGGVEANDGAFLADPVFEAARAWETADHTLGDLSGGLLHPDTVNALDGASAERVPRDRPLYSHQLAAWKAAGNGLSCLVSSGTGSGKTECFMVPMLNDLVTDPARGKLVGVRAIVIYPLNALIESQRERLAAWTEALKNRVSFALYNGLTPETPNKVAKGSLAAAELGDRRSIREAPPSVLVTNVTMLEYLLLRAQDRPILDKSQGLLRWIVLDEAHSYIGAQAAEMSLLLRRVRAAFGVKPEQVRLMATSATISDGERTKDKLTRFVGDLAGLADDRVCVIEGRSVAPVLPPAGPDRPLDAKALDGLDPALLWDQLAPHPRIQKLQGTMSARGVTLTEVATTLLGPDGISRRAEAQLLLDAAALAIRPGTEQRLLPWRAHLFHRAQGGFWVCIDPACPHRDAELAAEGSGWGFGAVWLTQRDHCTCKAPVFELVACTECGTEHLSAGLEVTAVDGHTFTRLIPVRASDVDDFAVDVEPDSDTTASVATRGNVVLIPARGNATDYHLRMTDGAVFDNAPPADGDSRIIAFGMLHTESDRTCCPAADTARLAPQRYGPAFFMGNGVPLLVEALASPMEAPGLPMGGRRAITFSDSRQGTARLAAKLQQDAERGLTRAFLFHSVQEGRRIDGEDRAKLERKLKLYQTNPEEFADDIRRIEIQLSDAPKPVLWPDLIDRFAQQDELRNFATGVWAERVYGGREMAENPRKLAEMFLLRELFRRPRVQNNAETMGLLRLTFPRMEEKAHSTMPAALMQVGASVADWVGLALAALDFVFRDNTAVSISPDWMVPLVSPRGGWLKSICRPGLLPADRPIGAKAWPGAIAVNNRPSRLQRMVYALIKGSMENGVDQDRAADVLTALWSLITTTAAKDAGGGAYRVAFATAGALRLEQAWLCPVTRRVFGYSAGGMSPYDIGRPLTRIILPRLPLANPGGLDPERRAVMTAWCSSDPLVLGQRHNGQWTPLHDRAATYARFLRAQEHSAQIKRAVLRTYEDRFKEGRINLLNCSTTMEMGVDIPNVRLVVNANVPPAVSNYRQRVGRAGRRGEPWAFGVTFCRNLPLDQIVFDTPTRLLSAQIAAPAVRLDSPSLVARHVHAALLAAFLRDQGGSFSIKASTGEFFGATDDRAVLMVSDAPADGFLAALRSPWAKTYTLSSDLALLVRATALKTRSAAHLAAETAVAFEKMLGRWRAEYSDLISRAETAPEPEVKAAFSNRAKRMKGEFLLGELARRGFTPAYGFPVDVVSFDHLSGHDREATLGTPLIAFGDRQGGASRTLDVAIREYAPGAEVVVDGLVHKSEGVLPAWGSKADASGLEDLQQFWECRSCRGFGLARTEPKTCPLCDTPQPDWKRSLRPAGFLGRHAPHTGYENLGHAPYEMPRISAAGAPWQSLPDPVAGRLRADPDGQVITLGSGMNGFGYAICLACGRAEAETEENPGFKSALPAAIAQHKPLAAGHSTKLAGGYCPGGYTEPQLVQRNVRLIHEARTDVFELQLPRESERAAGLALAAALRDALAERLGADTREIGLAVGGSVDATKDPRVSIFLHDRAAGGAGLVARLAEAEWFRLCLTNATERLECSEACAHGCPACILRPDLNFGEERLDRPAGLALAKALQERLNLPTEMQIFGSETRVLGLPLPDWLDRQLRVGRLQSVTLYLHAAPAEWELPGWPVARLLARLKDEGVVVQLVLASAALTDKALEMAQKLDLHRLSAHVALAHTPELPEVGGCPVLAVVTGPDGSTAIAAPDRAEAVPGPGWGLGANNVLVRGVAPAIPAAQTIGSERFIALSSGNARLIRLRRQLDGPVATFGRAFWKAIAAEAPLTIAALQAHGVQQVEYTDRYLLNPLSLRLLAEVMVAMPGTKAPPTRTILTARQDRAEPKGWAIFHSFPDDSMRRTLVEALLPRAIVEIRSKAALLHARSMALVLGDGQRITFLLDQGFGAWRAEGQPRHDFSSDPVAQARALKVQVFSVSVNSGQDAPLVLEQG